jgi:hypothetical protein
VARTLEDGTGEDILAWAHAHGIPRTDEECVVWNRFMTKASWRDDRSARLQQLVVEYGLAGKPIETVFDFFDYDEGRDSLCRKAVASRVSAVVRGIFAPVIHSANAK